MPPDDAHAARVLVLRAQCVEMGRNLGAFGRLKVAVYQDGEEGVVKADGMVAGRAGVERGGLDGRGRECGNRCRGIGRRRCGGRRWAAAAQADRRANQG
ncbi:MAG: hypothetical protein M5R40_09300 [Anaerolineae bacterium]|nr:hypothetical protein [Anaerolineae bacterium]